MKKILLILCTVFLLTSCSSNTNDNNYNGKATSLSKKHLSKGYIVNVYRSTTPLSDKDEDYGKGYITMTFSILIDHTSTIDYNNKNEFIKKQIVSNIKIKKSPKMGIVGDIYGNYQSYGGSSYKMVGSKNKYEKTFNQPMMSGEQSSIAIELDRIALMDSAKYPESSSISQIYNALGITRDSVAMTVSFRIELITVDDKVLYKDYEIEVPSKSFDISGSEFRTDFITTDINKMETYLEKQ